MCVNLDHPTLRLFLADRGGNGKAHLDVKAIYEGLDGTAHDLTLAKLKVGPTWEPSLVMPIGINMLSVASASGWTPSRSSSTCTACKRARRSSSAACTSTPAEAGSAYPCRERRRSIH